MKQYHLNKKKLRIWGGIQLLSVMCCFRLLASEAPSKQPPILFHTLTEYSPSHAWPEGEKALIRELRRSGYNVRIQPGTSVLTDSTTLQIHEDISVVQMVKLPDESQATIDIWFYQKTPPNRWHTSINQLETITQESAVVAALKFNELYSAKLEKLKSLNPIDPPKNKAIPLKTKVIPPKPKETPAPYTSHFHIGFGATTSFNFSNAPMRVGPVAELIWTPNGHLLFSLRGAIKIWGKEISFESQRAILRQYDLAFHLDYVLRRRSVIGPFVGAFVAGTRFQTQGNANDSLIATEERVYSLGLGVQTGLLFAISQNISLVTTLSIGTLLPNVELFFGHTSVAKYGPFQGNTSLAIRIHF